MASRMLHALLAASWLAAVPAAAAMPEPVAWQEPAPVARLFLQLPFEAPEPLAAGRLGLDATLSYSNSLLLAENARLALEADVETASVSLLLRAGLAPGLEGQLRLAATADLGGFLDRPIEVVEGLFHAGNPERVGRPRGVATWRLVRPGGPGVVRRGDDVGVADPWIGLKLQLCEQDGRLPALSLRVALALPLARPPFGAGMPIPGVGVLAGWSGERFAVRLAADLAVPTARLAPVDLATRPYGTVQLGLTYLVSPLVGLQLQASGHGAPVGGTGLAQLDKPVFYVLVGATRQIGAGLAVDLGLVENVFSPYRGADLAFVMALRMGR